MTGLFYPFFEFDFMRRALVGCLMLSLGAAPVGVFMVLRRISLTGDALSHAVLPGIAIGYLIAGLSVAAMAIGGLLAGCLVALASSLSSRWSTVPEDRNLAAWYLIALALGVFLISVRGGSVDLMHVLFGAALGLDDAALLWVAFTATVTVWVLLLLFRPLVLDSVDPGSLRNQGSWSWLTHGAFVVLIVFNLVAGLHAMGTLMAVGLMILPATIASYWCRHLDTLLLVAVLLAGLASFAGLLGSFYADWPTSPTIILVLGIAYLLSVLLGSRQGLVRMLWQRPVQTREIKEL
jgi:zinc/manganese transport system permease protein